MSRVLSFIFSLLLLKTKEQLLFAMGFSMEQNAIVFFSNVQTEIQLQYSLHFLY